MKNNFKYFFKLKNKCLKSGSNCALNFAVLF